MRRSPRARAVGGLATVLLAGCHSPTDPGTLDVTFVARVRSAADAPPGATSPPTVRGEGTIDVRGLLETSTQCQDVTASARRGGGTVVLTVSSKTLPLPCTSVTGEFAYDAAITNLPAGSYRVLVYHATDDQPSGTPSGGALVRDTSGVLVRYIG